MTYHSIFPEGLDGSFFEVISEIDSVLQGHATDERLKDLHSALMEERYTDFGRIIAEEMKESSDDMSE